MTGWAPLALCLVLSAGAARGQSAPTIDTEDASLGSARVGDGWIHPMASFDIRNGDFARGGYDADGAGLDRLPVHAQFGATFDLHRGPGGEADAWLVLNSSNGFHRPNMLEPRSPRSWYESNNLVGLVASPVGGLKMGLAYAIKTSPNVRATATTTHEASFTAAYEADSGFGALNPGFVATTRMRGGPGLFAQISIEPEMSLAEGDMARSFSFPARVGVGFNDFYEPGTGDVAFGAVGLAYSHPFDFGALKWRFRAEAVAIVRDDTLRALGGKPDTVAPLATIGVSVAY